MKIEKARPKIFQNLIFFSLLFLIFAAKNLPAQEYRQVVPGVEHAKFIRKIKDEPVAVNILRLDLTKVRLDVVHAMDAAIGLETTSSIAARYGATAAINAGFFRLDKSIFAGDAAGILQIDGKLLSENNNGRIALLINNESKQTVVDFKHSNLSSNVFIGKIKLEILGINRQRNDNDLVLFTPEFHHTTLTNQNGLEVVVKNNKIVQIIDRKGSNEIPCDGFILSASGNKREEFLKIAKINLKIKTNFLLSVFSKDPKDIVLSFAYVEAEDIVGGVPQLIRNGKIEITWEQEKAGQSFVKTLHPRTAVAKLKDGKFLMVTVDGRQPGTSVGVNLQELAEMLLELGAIDAMNLDGGGSTTMFVGGKVINQPSDKEGERKVSDAILVFPRQTQTLTTKK